MSDGKQDLSVILFYDNSSCFLSCRQELFNSCKSTRKEIAHMKALIILTVFLASATGMSEATAPLRSFYRTREPMQQCSAE